MLLPERLASPVLPPLKSVLRKSVSLKSALSSMERALPAVHG